MSSSDRKVLLEFMTQTDGVGGGQGNVFFLAATNEPWDLDSAMLDRCHMIYVPLPDEEARLGMFKMRLKDTPNVLQEEDYRRLARETDGASARDVDELAQAALNEPIAESIRAKHFKITGGKYVPTNQCALCPDNLSICGNCGAKEMSVEDIPHDKLTDRDITMQDFEVHLKSSYHKLSDEDLQRYTDWAEKF